MKNHINKANQRLKTRKREKEREFYILQGNLFALNATFEAARAGESGAEFALEAEKGRNSAMLSAEAAKKKTN